MIGKEWNPNTLREMTDSLSEGLGSKIFYENFYVFSEILKLIVSTYNS